MFPRAWPRRCRTNGFGKAAAMAFRTFARTWSCWRSSRPARAVCGSWSAIYAPSPRSGVGDRRRMTSSVLASSPASMRAKDASTIAVTRREIWSSSSRSCRRSSRRTAFVSLLSRTMLRPLVLDLVLSRVGQDGSTRPRLSFRRKADAPEAPEDPPAALEVLEVQDRRRGRPPVVVRNSADETSLVDSSVGSAGDELQDPPEAVFSLSHAGGGIGEGPYQSDAGRPAGSPRSTGPSTAGKKCPPAPLRQRERHAGGPR